MSLMFPSEQWVAALVAACNRSPQFAESAGGWHGAVGCEVLDLPAPVSGPVFFRLDGEEGRWTTFEVGASPGLASMTRFTISASHAIWKAVIRQEIHPIKGLIQGRLRVTGQLSSLLRWSAALGVVTRIAGELDTTFADEE